MVRRRLSRLGDCLTLARLRVATLLTLSGFACAVPTGTPVATTNTTGIDDSSAADRVYKFTLKSLSGSVNETISLSAKAEPSPPPGVDWTFENPPGKVRGRGQKVTLKNLKPDPNTFIDLRKNAEPALSGAFQNQHGGLFRGGDEVFIDSGKFILHKKSGERVPRSDLRGDEQIADAMQEMLPYTNATHVAFNDIFERRVRLPEQLYGPHEHFDEAKNDANFEALEKVAEILNKYPHVFCHIHCDLGVPREVLDGEVAAAHVESYYERVASQRVQAVIDELNFTHKLKADNSRFRSSADPNPNLMLRVLRALRATLCVRHRSNIQRNLGCVELHLRADCVYRAHCR